MKLERILFCLALLPGVVFTQSVDTMFTRQFNSAGNGADYLTDMVVAPNGNVYMTGIGQRTLNSDDYWTVACDRWGRKLWDAYYGDPAGLSDSAAAIALDSRGDIYVTGVSYVSDTATFTTVKYRNDSMLRWVSNLRFPGELEAGGVDIVTKDSTAVYACGWRHPADYDFNYVLVKFNPATGDTIWTRSYDRPGELDEDMPVALALDRNGNIVVTGYSYSLNTDYDYCTIKYDSLGTLIWQRFYDFRPAFSEDAPNALAIDASGSVVVTGRSYSDNTDYDIATVRYGPSGDTSFIVRYNRAPANDEDHGLAVTTDLFNNAYVAGYSYDLTSDFDYTMLKYNSIGTQLWLQRYDGGNTDDEACALTLDGALNVLVSGFTVDPANDDDIVTVKLNGTNGVPQWTHTYNDPFSGQDDPQKIVVGAGGMIFIGAQVPGDTSDVDFALLRLYEQTHDIGPVAVIAPVDTVFTGDTLVPKVVIHNYGMYLDTVLVRVQITNGYTDTLRYVIDVGDYDTLSFRSVVESLVGNYTLRCTTMMASDVNPLNNWRRGTFIVTTRSGIRQDPRQIVVIEPYLQIAPNPAVVRASVSYAVPDPERLSLKVYDATGRMVRNLASGATRRIGIVSLDVRDLAAGVYVVKLDTPRERFTKKLVIEK
jgi:hypothetical protein